MLDPLGTRRFFHLSLRCGMSQVGSVQALPGRLLLLQLAALSVQVAPSLSARDPYPTRPSFSVLHWLDCKLLIQIHCFNTIGISVETKVETGRWGCVGEMLPKPRSVIMTQ